MRVCILMGSPRKTGNTNALRLPFQDELEQLGHTVTTHWLYDLDIRPCTACRTCQRDWSGMGCAIRDDVPQLAEEILQSDLLVLATPHLLLVLHAPHEGPAGPLVYGLCKYYGEEKGPSLLRGRRAAILTTCGYRPEKGADLFQEGVRRYCKHTGMTYAGLLAERHLGYDVPFMDGEKEQRARAFARMLVQR